MKSRSFRTTLMLFFSLLFAGVILVACDGGDEEAGGGGLVDETPVIDATEPLEEEPAFEPTLAGELTDVPPGEAETPQVTEPTATMEMAEPTATMEMAEPTATAEMAEPTEEADEQTGVQPGMMVAQATTLIGMSIADDSGQALGTVRDILVDDSGAFQYVIVEALDVSDVSDDTATMDETPTADDEVAQDGTDAAIVSTVALPWTDIEVVSDAATDATEAGDAEDSSDDEILDDDNDEDLLNLVYRGDVALEEQQAFDALILDEQGAVLDGEAVDADDVAIPSEFANLIQLSEYDELNLLNTNGEDVGEIEDALVNVSEGRVLYVIADFGGFLGIGEKTVAVPWSEVQTQVTSEDGEENETFTVDADQQRMEDAPEIDLGNWDPNVDVDWDAEFSEFWQTEVESDGSG